MKNLSNRIRVLCVGMAMVSVSALYGATAAQGLFTVNAQGKTVQFANANSIYSDKELIQWSHLPDAIESGWEVLTGAEWSYLLASGRPNAEDKNALGTVNGTKGLIILPDEWTQPAGAPTYKKVTETGISYEYNTYSTEQWALMSAAGAVFLPCGGYGYDDAQGYHTENTDDHGAYWAADTYVDDAAYANCMRFNTDGEGSIHDLNHQVKTTYYNVILVREVVILDEMDELSAFTTKMNNANLKRDFAFVRRTLKKDGTFYTLCLPFDVPDIDQSPLAGAEVFTFDGGTVSGATGDEVLNLQMTVYANKRLDQGVPYILRWSNTGETLATPLYFANVENWDDDTNAGTDPGNETIKYHGVYPRARIPGYETGEQPHYNFFMGANNTLYWPDDSLYPDSKMKGFRAYFYIIPGGGPNPVSVRRGMQPVWKIREGLGSATGVEILQPSAIRTQKILRDGQIYIKYKGTKYDVQGKVKSER